MPLATAILAPFLAVDIFGMVAQAGTSASVPEPSSLLLVGLMAGGFFVSRRWHRRTVAD